MGDRTKGMSATVSACAFVSRENRATKIRRCNRYSTSTVSAITAFATMQHGAESGKTAETSDCKQTRISSRAVPSSILRICLRSPARLVSLTPDRHDFNFQRHCTKSTKPTNNYIYQVRCKRASNFTATDLKHTRCYRFTKGFYRLLIRCQLTMS